MKLQDVLRLFQVFAAMYLRCQVFGDVIPRNWFIGSRRFEATTLFRNVGDKLRSNTASLL